MDVVTETLNKASDLLKHIPGVGEVIKVASAIAQKVEDIQDARDACRELGQRAIGITLKICQQLRAHKNNQAVTDNLNAFRRTLQAIQEVMNRRLAKGLKNTLKFMANTGKIAKKTRKLEGKLDDAMRLLGIELSLDHSNALQNLETMARNLWEEFVPGMEKIQAGIARIERTQQQALIPIHEGPLKNIGHSALVLLRSLNPIEVRTAMQPEGEIITRWKAAWMTPSAPARGKAVILHKYTRTDGGFADALKIAKAWHPYILPILGRSPPGQADEAYIVIDDYLDVSCYQPFEEYSRSLSGFDNLRGMLIALKDLCEVADYLEGEELHHVIVYDRPTSRWLLNDERDVEQSELFFDLRPDSRRIKWKLDCPVPGEVLEEHRNHTPLFGLPALSTSRKRLTEEMEDVLALPNGPRMAEKWFFFLQAQSSLLGLHRLAATIEPDNLESLAPVGAWLAQTLVGTDSARWSQLALDDFEMHPQQASWFLPMYEEHSPEGTSPQTDADDARLVTIFRAGVYPSDAYYARATSRVRDETNVDFFLKSDKTTWKRSRFPSLHFGTTLSFPQHVGSNFTMPQVLPSLSDTVLDKQIAIVTAATYIVETTLDRSAYVEQKNPTPLWFFILEHNNIHNYRLRRDVPWGFWSAEENPTSIPPGITFLSTPSVQGSAFPFVWNQELGGRVFCIRARVALECMTLTKDEALVLKQCYGKNRNFDEKTIAEPNGIQEYNANQGEAHLNGTTITASVEECDADHGEECTLGGSTADEGETKFEDQSEAGTKVDDKQPEQAPLHFPTVVSFLAIALFLMIAPSFIIVPCLVIVPIVIAVASHIPAESRRVGQ
ncbi:hypothetical protein VTO73DRAFT_1574 [Trametes versicolor]